MLHTKQNTEHSFCPLLTLKSNNVEEYCLLSYVLEHCWDENCIVARWTQMIIEHIPGPCLLAILSHDLDLDLLLSLLYIVGLIGLDYWTSKTIVSWNIWYFCLMSYIVELTRSGPWLFAVLGLIIDGGVTDMTWHVWSGILPLDVLPHFHLVILPVFSSPLSRSTMYHILSKIEDSKK